MRPVLDRVMDKVSLTETGCWEFGGAHTHGYGHLSRGRRGEGHLKAHRVTYEAFIGPIPEGLIIDHLCRNRACVNPWHLEPVTNRENLIRGDGFVGHQVARTHCPKGHPYLGDNLYVSPRGKRECKTCTREKLRALRAAWPPRTCEKCGVEYKPRDHYQRFCSLKCRPHAGTAGAVTRRDARSARRA